MKSQNIPHRQGGIIDQRMEKFKMTKRTAKDYSKINPKEISLKNHLNAKILYFPSRTSKQNIETDRSAK